MPTNTSLIALRSMFTQLFMFVDGNCWNKRTQAPSRCHWNEWDALSSHFPMLSWRPFWKHSIPCSYPLSPGLHVGGFYWVAKREGTSVERSEHRSRLESEWKKMKFWFIWYYIMVNSELLLVYIPLDHHLLSYTFFFKYLTMRFQVVRMSRSYLSRRWIKLFSP